ncbi:MAG: sodium bicarbonate transporter family protein [Verrucomicrobiota bacterium]|nr:sodium bicarbonate transporter family protein [Verrucomicrobiota bacterium]
MNETNQGLERTGRFCGGLMDDIKRRAPHYASDFYQGLHPKVIGSSLFMFFACLANAIAFGVLTSEVTNGEIGTSEMLIVTAIGGVCFALFSGQPLTILGGTGPIVIFTGLLYMTCESMGIPFLPTYAWVGVWSGLFLIICAVTDLSYLMKYFTRFTDEIFAALVAVIFIVEAIKDVVHPFTHPAEGQDQISHDTAFLTLILALGTFMIARNLKAFRNSNYLRWTVREFLADFGPSIAIGIMTIVAVSFGALHADLSLGDSTFQIGSPEGIALKVADVPETFVPPSMIPMFSVPVWVIFFSIIPALMATILLYLDQNITTRLVNAPGNRLMKGAGFHLDLLVVGLITLVGSVFGLPWMVAATVHALNHVKSLATQETVNIGGDIRERIKEVRENRISPLIVHLLIGASLLLLPLVTLIPNAVLFGLFLYMGVTTLGGNDFFDRIRLWITDPALYPKTHYIRTVPLKTIHAFTALQLLGLVSLWVLKTAKIQGYALGIFFPLLIALLVPFRMAMARFFDTKHLDILDAEESEEEIGDQELHP